MRWIVGDRGDCAPSASPMGWFRDEMAGQRGDPCGPARLNPRRIGIIFEVIPDESIGSAQGGIIAAAGYFPALIGFPAVVASGGTLLGVIAGHCREVQGAAVGAARTRSGTCAPST